MTQERIIESGGKAWEKGSKKRVYFNTREVVAKFFGYKISKNVSGVIPAGYEGLMKPGKTRSYFDVVSGVFYADKGDIANAARAAGMEVERI